MSINADPFGLPDGGTTTTGQLVMSIAQSGSDNGLKCFETLVKAVCNTVDKPEEPRYRELRRDVAAVVQVDAVPACAMLLRRLGFKDMGDRYRLQNSGLRSSEVARFQSALNELEHCSDLVVRLAPAIHALGLHWTKPDGSSTFMPGPTYRERQQRDRDLLQSARNGGSWTGQTAPGDLPSAEDEEDAQLQEALRLSMIESSNPWLRALLRASMRERLRTKTIAITDRKSDAAMVLSGSLASRMRLRSCETTMDRSSVRLPVNPLPVDALNPFQAPSDQTIKRVTALETSMMEITRRLDDWTEVTRQGIADLRAEIGAVKLEQRFSQTLRNAPNEGDVLNGFRQDAATGTPLEGGKQAEDSGEGLKHRFEVFEEKLSAIHSEHMLDTTSMRERLEAALQQSDSQTSRADELQALLKEEEGRRMLLFVRLEAVEASLQDLRTNQRDIASANEVTERVLKGELKKEASGMLQELDARLKALESSAATDTVAAVQSNTAADLGEMRASLLSSTNDIQRLAKEVATIREEHDQAIGDLGSLTERVAKSAIAGIQRSEVELSQLILARVEPRVASLEAKIGGTQAEDLTESTETGIMGATRHVAETSSSEVEPSWVQDERKSQGKGPDGPDNLRQGVKDKLQGITDAVQQVLGALESGEKVGETRPPGTLDKQRMQESSQPTSALAAPDFWQASREVLSANPRTASKATCCQYKLSRGKDLEISIPSELEEAFPLPLRVRNTFIDVGDDEQLSEQTAQSAPARHAGRIHQLWREGFSTPCKSPVGPQLKETVECPPPKPVLRLVDVLPGNPEPLVGNSYDGYDGCGRTQRTPWADLSAGCQGTSNGPPDSAPAARLGLVNLNPPSPTPAAAVPSPFIHGMYSTSKTETKVQDVKTPPCWGGIWHPSQGETWQPRLERFDRDRFDRFDRQGCQGHPVPPVPTSLGCRPPEMVPQVPVPCIPSTHVRKPFGEPWLTRTKPQVDSYPVGPLATSPLVTVPAPVGPAPGSFELPSIGSQGHSVGQCKPCAFLHTKGCDNGAVCKFCHLCEPGEKKRRQKEKRQMMRGSSLPSRCAVKDGLPHVLAKGRGWPALAAEGTAGTEPDMGAEGCCTVLAPSEILDSEPWSEIPGTEGFVGQIANDIDRELAEPRPRPLIFPFSTVVASAQCHRLVRHVASEGPKEFRLSALLSSRRLCRDTARFQEPTPRGWDRLGTSPPSSIACTPERRATMARADSEPTKAPAAASEVHCVPTFFRLGPFVWAFVAFSSVLHFFEQYLEWRQLQKNRETAVPAEFQGVVDESKFLESQVYQKDKRLFGFVKDWVSFIYDKVQLFLITPWLWHYAVAVFGEEAEYSCTLFWLFLLQWVEKPISIPFSLYSNFVVEDSWLPWLLDPCFSCIEYGSEAHRERLSRTRDSPRPDT
ncbi:FACE1 [Symbiodinium necroappetens]|uniref:FACE1 protein n=1 Tax=Symbiodinium necroappetens TaxID=1628268 RepID=A0A813BES4_9DINO|nr:FACE1 [Symbiodinium necroappetens]